MSLSTFLRFAVDFEITVVLLSKVQLIHSFKRSKFGAHDEPIDSNPHTRIKLNFQGTVPWPRIALGPSSPPSLVCTAMLNMRFTLALADANPAAERLHSLTSTRTVSPLSFVLS